MPLADMVRGMQVGIRAALGHTAAPDLAAAEGTTH
jgi:hypothetical protein